MQVTRIRKIIKQGDPKVYSTNISELLELCSTSYIDWKANLLIDYSLTDGWTDREMDPLMD